MGGRHSKQERFNVYSANYNNNSSKPSVANPYARGFADADAEDVSPKDLQSRRTVSDQPFTPSFPNDFYDGIPRYQSFKSRSFRARQVAKVSEVSSRLGKAGTHGLGRAVRVLDTLGSSMTSLNPKTGFVSGVTAKNELAILAFEVANTIVKGANLMQSLSKRNRRVLEEVVLPSEGVQNLVSQDMDQLLRIFANDKREELKIFGGEVVRFGNRCKDSQWHNLDRYFDKICRDRTPQRQLKDEAESIIELLMNLVQFTAELYAELVVLDRMEQDCQHKCQDEANAFSPKGDNASMLRELKSQRKLVRNLKKKSLWSWSLEEVMEKLVDIVHFLLMEINNTFGTTDGDVEVEGSVNDPPRLGAAGLSLHYANIIMQIDIIVARSSSIPPNARDTLYQSLPPNIKSTLRIKLQSFRVKEELTITEIKDEMEKTLHWLVPISTNTAKAHHGFGWVGEWANTGPDGSRKTAPAPLDIIRIETLHHASKEKTEAYIIDLLLWLHHLVSKSKSAGDKGVVKASIKPWTPTSQESNQLPNVDEPPAVSQTTKGQTISQYSDEEGILRIGNSQDLDSENNRLTKNDQMSRRSSDLATSESKDMHTVKIRSSTGADVAFSIERVKTVDAIELKV